MNNNLEGKIAAILDEKTVVINRGISDGVNEGDKFHVYSEVGPFEDPDSGKELGIHRRIIGSVVVDTVEDKFCIASTPTQVVIRDFAGITQSLFMPEKRERPSLPIDESQKHEISGSFKVKVGTPVFRTEASNEPEESNGAKNDSVEEGET